ncbi:hypothetical protein [Altererythrobacter sp. MF3-039]|uniref:hypothetical protein n=1 Tax=Altererythrobacter sp. MF3-039 TaxID=3252901 RepID=UPI00390C7A29
MKIAIPALLLAAIISAPALAQTDQAPVEAADERDLKIAELTARIERLERLLDAREDRPPVTPASSLTSRAADATVDIERALERALVQDGTRLVAPGAIELVPSLSYAYSTNRDPFLVDADGTDVLIDNEQRRSTIEARLGARIGLPGNSQLGVSVPYRFGSVEEVATLAGTPVDARDRSASALGDVSLSLSHVLAGGDSSIPKVVGSLRGNLGNASRTEGEGILGGGFASLGVGMSVSQRLDPVVFAGSLSYDQVFAENGIAPGDRWSYSLAAYLAVAPEVSFRTLFRQQFSGDTRFAGETLEGSGQTSATLDFGLSVVPSRKALIDVGVAVGLTDNAPDFAITLATPLKLR